MEKSSTSVSARSTAFMPLVQSRLSQNMQFTWVTHLFLKLALDVDIVVLIKWTDTLALSASRRQVQQKKQQPGADCAHCPFNSEDYYSSSR